PRDAERRIQGSRNVRIECPSCQGNGWVVVSRDGRGLLKMFDPRQRQVTCSTCGGQGYIETTDAASLAGIESQVQTPTQIPSPSKLTRPKRAGMDEAAYILKWKAVRPFVWFYAIGGLLDVIVSFVAAQMIDIQTGTWGAAKWGIVQGALMILLG